MANRYIKNGSSGAADGTTKTDAFVTTLAGTTVAAAGDSLFSASTHAESSSSALTYTLPDNINNAVRITSINWGTDEYEKGAAITTTVASTITITGNGNIKGLVISAGSGGSIASINIMAKATVQGMVFDDCDLILANTGSSSIAFGSSAIAKGNRILLRNCRYKFGHTQQKFVSVRVFLQIEGGSFITGSAVPALGLFQFSGGTVGSGDYNITGMDFAALANTMTLFNAATGGACKAILRNCKFPASWDYTTKTFVGTLTESDVRAEMHNFLVGSTRVPHWVQDIYGSSQVDRTNVRAGGANDGAALAWKVITTASAATATGCFRTMEFPAKWNATTGSSKTVTVEILADDATALTNDDIRLVLITSDGIFTSERNFPAAATTLDASTETWDTTGITNVQKRKISVSFTPAVEGYIQARLEFGKASLTCRVDPLLTVA